ncbi:hypothetical protein CCACVL1_12879 [Corchorus capsularis]|uniref:Uncharacterized protein n=1 Tax=Corchorus capsularis TaxID=210143 RepID=A0A1R3IDC3_COCAP|nr:hypothetical protein CCACVL1_12879 [Corchorus capsularis]
MALTVKQQIFLAIALAIPFLQVAISGDPDILTDFVVPLGVNASLLDGNFFTFTGMRPLITSPPPTNFSVTKAAMAEFPALNGQSVSYALLQYSAAAGTVSVPSTLFATGVDDEILAKSFKTDVSTIQKLKAGLAPHA